METRLVEPRDYTPEGLDRLIAGNRDGDVRIDRDRIILAGPAGRPLGCLIWRPTGYIHEFECGNSLSRLSVADALVRAAMRDAASHFLPQQALFLVKPDNHAMRKYIESEPIGATEQEGVIYTIDL